MGITIRLGGLGESIASARDEWAYSIAADSEVLAAVAAAGVPVRGRVAA